MGIKQAGFKSDAMKASRGDVLRKYGRNEDSYEVQLSQTKCIDHQRII
jgi:hypothetical protein